MLRVILFTSRIEGDFYRNFSDDPGSLACLSNKLAGSTYLLVRKENNIALGDDNTLVRKSQSSD